jgi:hypothetical protein
MRRTYNVPHHTPESESRLSHSQCAAARVLLLQGRTLPRCLLCARLRPPQGPFFLSVLLSFHFFALRFAFLISILPGNSGCSPKQVSDRRLPRGEGRPTRRLAQSARSESRAHAPRKGTAFHLIQYANRDSCKEFMCVFVPLLTLAEKQGADIARRHGY